MYRSRQRCACLLHLQDEGTPTKSILWQSYRCYCCHTFVVMTVVQHHCYNIKLKVDKRANSLDNSDDDAVDDDDDDDDNDDNEMRGGTVDVLWIYTEYKILILTTLHCGGRRRVLWG